eukprot:jgi/Botrbrau1/13928/Bobra.136_2s0016.5
MMREEKTLSKPPGCPTKVQSSHRPPSDGITRQGPCKHSTVCSEKTAIFKPCKGDVIRVGANPEPAWFRVSARPHPRFQREGADLITTSTIPLVQALTGGCLQVETLSGRVLSVPIAQVVPEGHTITLPGEGLPCNGGKGTMRVRLHIQFPEQLTGQQKALIRAALHFPSKPQTNHSQAATGFLENFHHPALGWSAVFPKSSGP